MCACVSVCAHMFVRECEGVKEGTVGGRQCPHINSASSSVKFTPCIFYFKCSVFSLVSTSIRPTHTCQPERRGQHGQTSASKNLFLRFGQSLSRPLKHIDNHHVFSVRPDTGHWVKHSESQI